jgi:hypothetical protein
MSRVLASLALATVAATGCAMMMKGMTPTPRTADNPLVSGQPLETTKKASLGVVSEQDCSIWPFEDAMSVSVTDAQICITSRKHVEQPPGWTGEPTANRQEGFSVANEANEGGYINTDKVKAAKVGTCFNKGYNKQIAIYAFDYKGCAPNNGTVSKTTKSLRVGSESWSFAGAAAAPTQAAAAPPAS